jgi:hypothetical protein
MIPDIPFRNEEAGHEFLSTAAATMAGAYIGHKLDQTKAGRWVNESPTANAFFAVLKTVSIAVAVGLFVIFLICLATV